MQLNSVLRDARTRAGLSLRDVERRVGISNGYLSLIESGQAQRPSPRYLHSLADVYGVSYTLLMELAGHVAPAPAPTDAEATSDEFGDLSALEREQVRAFASFLRASRSSGSRDEKAQT
jgi:transcriptional regulator with XRE-family HTH domain